MTNRGRGDATENVGLFFVRSWTTEKWDSHRVYGWPVVDGYFVCLIITKRWCDILHCECGHERQNYITKPLCDFDNLTHDLIDAAFPICFVDKLDYT
jgi:hypothetical protein